MADVETSIGMPVFNGENFLAPAIESILDQTYGAFELVISDNASTDGTRDICESFARQDRRVQYFRNDRNLGADPNYNAVFRKSRGRFFKWAAHDDLLAPTFLERCVAALKGDPDSVLVQSLVYQIDEAGHVIGEYDSALEGVSSFQASERFGAAILTPHWCTEIFGLIRRDALARTSLHGGYHHSDRALLAELALLGRFVQIREPLFLNREHASRYVRAARGPDRIRWHDTSRTKRVEFAIWKLLGEYRRMISRYVDDPVERRKCRAQLRRWYFRNWNGVRMITEPAAEIWPGLGDVLSRLRRRRPDATNGRDAGPAVRADWSA